MSSRGTELLIAAMVAACLSGAGYAAADPDTPAPTPPQNSAASPPAATPTPPTTEHGAPTGAAEAPGPAGPGPLAAMIDHNGTFAVGADILPGVYTSPGPVAGDTCYWRRIGADGSTLDNALTKQPQTVQIEATDKAFKTNGCQTWQLSADAAPPNQKPPWLSQLELRHSLDILNGLAGQSGNGQLPPY